MELTKNVEQATQSELDELISKMTLEEKAGLCSGADFWHTKKVERLGIPDTMVSDGPHGLRKQDLEGDHLGINDSIKAVCFPTGSALGSSFNRELIESMGKTIGNECQAVGVSVVLGPAVNIKRSPLCGRNFEYYSEDPYLATELAGAFIDGVQSKNVGTSIKHFLANNQETRRMSSSSEIDERTLNEIYLAAFEGAIKDHKPWTVMCSYNRVNGVYSAQNRKYLVEILRNKWNFTGYVVSDWGAVNNRVLDLKAGLDLEMPSSGGIGDSEIVEAVKSGELEESVLNEAVRHILEVEYRYLNNQDKTAVFDMEKDHEKARQVANETIVLLKNEGVLPLAASDQVAFIGKYAKKPRYQGGGSSHINSFKITSALSYIEENKKDELHIVYAQGFDDQEDKIDENMVKEAVETAKNAKVAVIFAGLPDSFESEGFDRVHMKMPQCQNYLIEEVTKVQPNTIVVLHNGSPVEMPWINQVKGVIEAYLGGQSIGASVVDVLYGAVNPSGRLAETFPLKLEDNPSYLYYIGEGDKVEYKEGIFVGYRYYDTKKMNVQFPFGYGLSYTTFEYSNLKTDKESMLDTDKLTVSMDVTNTGNMAGKEVVQLYVGKKESKVIRPAKELRKFTKINLEPGETKTVTFQLEKRAFAYYDVKIKDWYVESGEYDIMIGKNVTDIVLNKTVTVSSTSKLPMTITTDTTFGDVYVKEEAKQLIGKYLAGNAFFKLLDTEEAEESDAAAEAISKDMQIAMMNYMPIRSIRDYSNGTVTTKDLNELVEKLNQIYK
ncbi:MAG: glycoside hydrolase family 3 C-terminal domain-containing protein [bacterium]|nr:glycoside hydrolase family 3 C-terminal domain-containing protein [bacterium]